MKTKNPKSKKRDVTKTYTVKQFIEKIRRLADGLEEGKPFSIQIAGERIRVPGDAKINIEHEREGKAEEIEFQIVWENSAK